MTDITTLGIAVDSREVKEADKALGKLADTSEKTAHEIEAISKGVDALVAELRHANRVTDEAREAQNKLREAQKKARDEAERLKDEQIRQDNVTKILSQNSELLAKAGLAIASSVGVAAAAVSVLTKQAIEAADAVKNLSDRTGISTETLSAWQHAAKLSDVTNEELAGSIKFLTKNMADNAKEFEKYGIEVKDASGHLLPADQVMGSIADKMQQMTNPTEKAAMSMALLNKSGEAMITMLSDGSVGLEKARKEAELMGTIVGKDTAEAAAAFSDQLDRLSLKAKGVGYAIADFVLPALNQMANILLPDAEAKLRQVEIQLQNLTEEGVVRTEWQRQRIAELEKERGTLQDIVNLEFARKALVANAGNWSIEGHGRGLDVTGGQVAAALEAEKKRLKEYNAEQKRLAEEARRREEERRRAMHDNYAYNVDAPAGTTVQIPAELDVAGEIERARQEAEAEVQQEFDARKLEIYNQFVATKTELEQQAHEERMATLQMYNLDTESEELRHQAALGDISAQWSIKRRDFAAMTAQQQRELVLSQMTGLIAGAAQSSRAFFELNKAASIANVVMTTQEAAMNAYNWGMKYGGGPPAAYSLAALAVTAGLARVQAIRETSFSGGGGMGGGGSSVASGGALPANTVTPAQDQAIIAAAPKQQVDITLVGDAFDYRTIAEKLIPTINEAVGNGVELRVTQG